MDNIENLSSKELIKQLNTDSLANWSDVRRQEFKETFGLRVEAHRFILRSTAEFIARGAKLRRFIGDKHLKPIYDSGHIFSVDRYERGYYGMPDKIGGRDPKDLLEIARERANLILKNLPPVKDAVKILSADTAEKMDRVDAIKKEGQKLKDELESMSDSIDMDMLDQSMTLAQFRKMVRERETKRVDLIHKLNKLGAEGCELEDTINRRLYSGLPGLAEAVMKVVHEYLEREKAMDETNRRVGEYVMFGDSAAAMEMLRKFEGDELKVSDTIQEEFKTALDNLKLLVKKGKLPKELKELKG